ncbi:hypothetical protein ONZ45_g17896 [Pleurotus djamor]|nr:hypothetical protein ONZ45_g17896 [Pleurotus djamor]
MSAAARAEARRKAILSRGGDRLAKLTTSARGEDGSTYLNTGQSPPTVTFILCEESNMPTPPARPSASPSPQPSRHVSDSFGAPNVDPSVWSQEQQAQFMQALMGGLPGASPLLPGMPRPDSSISNNDGIPPTPPDDPFAALMTSLQQQQQHPMNDQPSGKTPAAVQTPPSKLQKIMPFIHLAAMWMLLGYFVLFKEPEMFKERTSSVDVGVWSRWGELMRSPSVAGAWGIALVPFFWAFTTIQIVLHSMRIISGFDTVHPPALLSLALPHLPRMVSTIVINGMKYMQMMSLFLDDLAGLVVGVGFIVFFSNLYSQ